MRAWELPAFGLEHLRLAERPAPRPGADEILIRVEAVSLNHRDLLVAGGRFFPALSLPFIPASDACGVVTATGAHVRRFRAGDRVITHYRQRWLDGDPGPEQVTVGLGGPLPGVLAEYITVPADGAVLAPRHLGFAEASTLPIAALTAWFALMEDGHLQQGQTVVAQGTGGVSLFGVQIAAAQGAQVILTSSSDARLARAAALGPVQTINYRRHPDWDQAVLDLTGGRGADHILEVAGGANLARSVRALALGGHIALIGFLEDSAAHFDVLTLMRKRAWIRGSWVGHRRAFEDLNRFLSERRIRPVIDTVYALDEAPEAFAHLRRGPFGKVAVAVGSAVSA